MALAGEFERIDRYLKPLSGDPEVSLELKDDAAQWQPPPGTRVVMTTDTMVAGRHFLPHTDPTDLGWKLATVNLSDLAGCGATPRGALLSLALPASVDPDWLAAFTQGLAQSRDAFGWDLWGGDSVSTDGPIVLGLTAIGTVPQDGMMRRDGARPGDIVLVSGTLGDAALGLEVKRAAGAEAGAYADLVARYDRPHPRIALGEALRPMASAGMDISDGVFGDAGHIARASGVTIRIDADRVPRLASADALLAKRPALAETALAGGDDYELLVTVAPERLADALSAAAACGVPLTDIGVCEAGSADRAVRCMAGGRERAVPTGWTHY